MGKKQKCPEFENHERWLVSYADMLTLLFAVFVVLFALKEGGEPQIQRTAGSMQESFNTPMEDIPVDRRNGPSEQGYGVFEHFRGNQVRPPLVEKFPTQQEPVKIIDEEMAKVKTMLEERLYGPKAYSDPKNVGNARIIDVSRTSKGFRLRLLARHFYNPGEVTVRPQARKELDQVTIILRGLGRKVTVEGHTDSIPPKGNVSNWEISALRATHIVRYMISQHRFPQMLLSAAGFADTRPIAHNGTEAGRRLNRRVEIHVHYDSVFDQNKPPEPP
ncbi:MAG: flagellar motor protein MotB [Deltaproteobacteria bacterium]|nr:flagellar motor protein MotB [Deltaproteobacteria bacterium]